MSRPPEYPDWATTDVVDGTSGQNNVASPSGAKRLVGWNRREKPPRQWFNWMGRLVSQWIRQIVVELDVIKDGKWTFPSEVATPVSSFSGTGFHTIAWAGNNRLAAWENMAKELRVYKFNGGFVSDATPLSIPASICHVCKLADGVVALFNSSSDNLFAYDVSGTTITKLGTELSIPSTSSPALCQIGEYRIAFIDVSAKTLRAYEYTTGTGTWAQVGAALSIPNIGVVVPGMASIGNNRIAFFESFLTGSAPDGANELRVYEFDGSIWAQTGTPLVIPGEGYRGLSALNSRDVIYCDLDNDEIRVYRNTSGAWVLVSLPFDASPVSSFSLSSNNGSEFAFCDITSSEIRYYRMNRGEPEDPYAP